MNLSKLVIDVVGSYTFSLSDTENESILLLIQEMKTNCGMKKKIMRGVPTGERVMAKEADMTLLHGSPQSTQPSIRQKGLASMEDTRTPAKVPVDTQPVGVMVIRENLITHL